MADKNYIGVDVGGTFTDLMLVDEGSGKVRLEKVPTTLEDRAEGFLSGIDRLGADLSSVDWIVHGTTAGTNAVLERKGASVGMITTRGFRDVLELGRRTRPLNYGLHGEFKPLVPRHMRLEVTERLDAKGRVITALDEEEVREAVRRLIEQGAETLVIHFMNSYVNPAHELRCGEITRAMWPNGNVVVGHQVLPEVREFERGTTAAIQAAIRPIVSDYISRVDQTLKSRGLKRDLMVMQGNGGMMAAGIVPDKAVHTVMSGPAAGVLAAAETARAAGYANIITGDMGGTSFDVALVVGGAPIISAERDIAYGLPVHVPMIDIHTIGSGGGSIAYVDAASMLRVGPESAGSYPGPIGFSRGGTRPTVTDANYFLGRLNPNAVTGSDRPADLKAVETALKDQIGDPLGLSPLEAATAILAVANHDMAEAIRLVSIERGHDPRDFTLFPFGGAGPIHAVALAKVIGIPTVLVPRFPGITSALGCILADVRHDFVNTVNRVLVSCSSEELDAIFAEQIAKAKALFEREASDLTSVVYHHEADLYYEGQSHTLRVPVTCPGVDPLAIGASFAQAFFKRFNIELTEMVPKILNLRTTAVGSRSKIDLHLLSGTTPPRETEIHKRSAYFDGDWVACPVHDRKALATGSKIEGPAIIEQDDTTLVIDPGATARVDEFGNIVIQIGEGT